MALLASELYRVKMELGYNALTIGALPYVEYTSLFDQVVAPFMSVGATTTTTTTVAAASTPTPMALTLASATGFDPMARIVVDVDARQEYATVQSVSGSVIEVLLSLPHGGTYPVTVEGGESLVRQKLGQLINLSSRLDMAQRTAGLKKADEVEFYPGMQGGSSPLTSLRREQGILRDELASLIGVQNMWRVRASGRQSAALY